MKSILSTKIFVASGSELIEERREAIIIIHELSKAFQHLNLEAVEWETDIPSGSYDKARVQDEINAELEKCDIVLVLFYSKLGKFTMEEYLLARGKNKKVFLYFKTEFSPKTREESDNYGKVLEFFEEIKREDKLIFINYEAIEDFKTKLYRDLVLYLSIHYPSAIVDEKEIRSLLYRGSRIYYDALLGPNGRFKYHRKISDIILPHLANEKTGIHIAIDNSTDSNKKETMANLLEALPLLWEKECKHAVIVGEAGIGKTASLIHLWGKLLENSDETKPVTVFIALNEYNQIKEEKKDEFILSMIQKNYGKASITQREIWEVMTRPYVQNESIPAMVLLLDGFKEIIVEKREFLLELNNIAEQCPRVQIVMTSRYDMRNNFKWGHWNLLELMQLEDIQVDKYLEAQGMELPRYERFRALCKNPMALTLYTGTFHPNELPENLDSLSKAKALRDIADLYREEKKFDKAYSFAMEAQKHDDRQEYEVIYKLGIYAALAGDTDNALIHIKSSIQFDQEYLSRVNKESDWEEIKTDILNHFGCFAIEETSKEPHTIDEFEVLFGYKEEVKEIQDKKFLLNVRGKLRIGYEGMKNSSFYISFNCIRSWFKFDDIRPQVKNLISLYKDYSAKSKKYSELETSIQTFKPYKKVIFFIPIVLFFASWIITAILYSDNVDDIVSTSNFFGKIIDILMSCIVLIFIFLLDLFIELLDLVTGEKSDLLSARFIMAYITFFIFSISCFLYDYNNIYTLKQKIKVLEKELKNIEEKIEAVKSDIIKQLSDISWQ